MPGDDNSPGSVVPETVPSPAPGQPLGALSRLPDVLLGLLCSYLSGRELCRLGASCANLHQGSHCVMPRMRIGGRLLLERESGSEEVMDRGRSAASRLARRAAGASVRELHIDDQQLIEPFLSALRAEEGLVLRTLTCLRLALIALATGP